MDPLEPDPRAARADLVLEPSLLVLRDGQQEYVFTPESSSTPSSADARR